MPRQKKVVMVGEGLPANVLKEFIDMSYLGNTSVAPAGYSIDAPLSDSRVKVYTKNGSNDKKVIVKLWKQDNVPWAPYVDNDLETFDSN